MFRTIDLHKISKHSKSRNQTSTQATEIIKKCLAKILHKIWQTETESPSPDEYEIFLDTINLQENPENLVNISQIKNEPSNWNIALSSDGTPISYKIYTGAQYNVIPVKSLENISPKS